MEARSTVPVRAVCACLTMFLALVSLPPAVGQEDAVPRKMPVVAAPERTDAGAWYGTWAYASRSDKMAMWIRDGEDGVPEIKLRWRDTSNPATFETDWTSRAEYDTRESHGVFFIEWSERGRDLLLGTWNWEVVGDGWSRLRGGPIRVYRSGDGRAAVCLFENMTEIRRRGDQERRIEYPQIWTFMKASRRLVRWEELPF